MATEHEPQEDHGPPNKDALPPTLTPDQQSALKRANLTPKQRLWIAMKPRLTRAQTLVALLCASLGFALVVQLQVAQQDEFASLRQSDLVNLLDDVTQRTSELEADLVRLRTQEAELESGSQSNLAALEAAHENARVQGILSGRLAAQGPGITIGVYEGGKELRAATLFNVLEELRNAGAEAVEVNGLRMVTSSHFVDLSGGGVEIDGIRTEGPFLWKAIGDPNTLQPALEIPGGALSSVRSSDATVTVTPMDKVEITATVVITAPKFAVPLETP
ncbi:DUF881 domain-containing protein [Jonesiaceae bacterium BS-20]|uniref:DUF881 domain-containing protein n=1 Tax=Jonesiaceae bacterium BS-20 TaxID=3120821 RepID=A0AAU7E0N7_9MICO